MRFLKLAILSTIILFIGIWLFSLLFPSSVRVSRAINIHRPAAEVGNFLRDISQWRGWNQFLQQPGMGDQHYTEKSFTSEELNVELLSASPDTIITQWSRKKGEVVTGGFALHETAEGITIVQWYFDFKLKWYPWEKFGSIVFDKQFGPAMEKSLDQLKQLVENR